jgi:hypothetical protein
MFADPITVTVAGSGKVMPRIESTGSRAVYQTADGLWTLTISHTKIPKSKGSKSLKIRSVARLVQKAIVADVLTAENDFEENVTQMIDERPEFGFSSTAVVDQFVGMFNWLTASTNAALIKFYGGES